MAVRLVIEGKISERGVLSPMTKEIYGPILSKLEKDHGIKMIEESEDPKK